jgi:hypothetical protein
VGDRWRQRARRGIGKGSLTHALIGLAIALCKVLANLVAAALGAPQAG